MAELLPEGNIEKPSASLSVEWFYMTFHRLDQAEYVRSGRKLCEESLKFARRVFQDVLRLSLERRPCSAPPAQ